MTINEWAKDFRSFVNELQMSRDDYKGIMEYIDDALALLKEQEAVKPYMDYDGQDVWRCGKCGNSLMHPSYYASDEDEKNHIRYCSHCGEAVKWNGCSNQ